MVIVSKIDRLLKKKKNQQYHRDWLIRTIRQEVAAKDKEANTHLRHHNHLRQK